MHKQTDRTERPMRAGHGEKAASRLGSGGNARAGESPAASTPVTLDDNDGANLKDNAESVSRINNNTRNGGQTGETK